LSQPWSPRGPELVEAEPDSELLLNHTGPSKKYGAAWARPARNDGWESVTANAIGIREATVISKTRMPAKILTKP